MQNSAAFQTKYVFRDFQAGIITGTMAIPLTVGIALMSNYPIKVALATVVFACFIGWINAWFKPGNFIGAPGVAAGLAPVLALGVENFGMENMEIRFTKIYSHGCSQIPGGRFAGRGRS